MTDQPDEIIKAIQHDGWLELTLKPELGDEYMYVLREHDPHGIAPALRDELQRMIDASEIVVQDEESPMIETKWVEKPA